MRTLGELLKDPPATVGQAPRPIHAEIRPKATIRAAISIGEEQIHGLVQQLFFGRESGLVRNVGVTPIEEATQTASLCLNIAQVLAAESRYDIGLIDASSSAVQLETQLQIEAPTANDVTWPIAPRLSLVSRQSWWPEEGGPSITTHSLERLRERMLEFDFCVLHCGPVSWITARIGQNCDGLVLVLTANQTRRVVAAQAKEQLAKAHVPLLGTVLVERRFPVPQSLYRSL